MYMDPSREQLLPKPLVEVVYAGGTISSLATDAGYREGGHVVDLIGLLEEREPGIQDSLNLGEASIAYTGLSENINEEAWQKISSMVKGSLLKNPNGVVITHGTDSMEQTARRLDSEFQEELRTSQTKIILTGANEDLSDLNTDAWSNLSFALQSAAGSAEPGVYVAFHGRLIPAEKVIKEPFNGSEMNFASVDDPEYLAKLQESRQLVRQQIESLEAFYEKAMVEQQDIIDYPVNTFRPQHNELLEYVKKHDVRAVLLTLYHSGTAHTQNPELSVANLAKRLAKDDVAVFAVTENGEEVKFGNYETSVLLEEAGIIPLGSLDHDVAYAKLCLASPTLRGNDLITEVTTDKTI